LWFIKQTHEGQDDGQSGGGAAPQRVGGVFRQSGKGRLEEH